MGPAASEEERKDGQKDVCVGGTEEPQEVSSVQPYEEGVTRVPVPLLDLVKFPHGP